MAATDVMASRALKKPTSPSPESAESHMVMSDLPDPGIIDEPSIFNNTDLYNFKAYDNPLMAVPAHLPDLGMAEEPIINQNHEITANSATIASAAIASAAIATAAIATATLVTDANNPPSVTDPSHGVRPVADLLPLHHEAAPLTNITNINNHVVESPHTSTPRHQRKHISIHSSNPLSPPQPFSDNATDQSVEPCFSPTKATTQPRVTLLRELDKRLALKEAAAAEMVAAAAASTYHITLPIMSQPSRPFYLDALAERAVAEAAAATSTTPAPPSMTPALVVPAPPPPPATTPPPATSPPPVTSSRNLKRNRNATSAMEAPVEETGRRIRRLTVFGLQREKAVEEQKAKAMKAASRKADREKVVRLKADKERSKGINSKGINDAGSKKSAVRGKKGKKGV